MADKRLPICYVCLQDALERNKAINQAPDLIASIREQLSVVYAAVNDKQGSDFNRNIYLDLQEQTRQDRYLESRAGILWKEFSPTESYDNCSVADDSVSGKPASVIPLLKEKKKCRWKIIKKNFFTPLDEWQVQNKKELERLNEEYQEIQENL